MIPYRFEAKKKYYIAKYGRKEGMQKFKEFLKKMGTKNGPHKKLMRNRNNTNKVVISTDKIKTFRWVFF